MGARQRSRQLCRACAAIAVLFGGADAVAGVERGDIRSIQAQTQRALETARTGTSRSWRNDATGATGTIRVVSTDHVPGTQPCRRYEWTAIATDGERMRATGEGCRMSGGTWELDENRRRIAAATPAREPRRERPQRQQAATPPPAPEPAPARATADAGAARAVPKTAPAAEAPAKTQAKEAAAPADPLADLVFTRPPRSAPAEAPADGG